MANKLCILINFFLICLSVNAVCVAETTLVNTTVRAITIFYDEASLCEDDEHPFMYDDDDFFVSWPITHSFKEIPLAVGESCLISVLQENSIFIVETKNPDNLGRYLQFRVKYNKLIDGNAYTVRLRKCSTRRQCGEFFCEWRQMPDSWCLQLKTNPEGHSKSIWVTPEEDGMSPE